uniref:CCHC-type domain-containing protein n=1 Tax=Tanacetum cinerariifolium TaxID=118510 RepID=A0A6L2NX82_TANCI|nr:hypothetical protein [Tanacetum cinerariifolium]
MAIAEDEPVAGKTNAWFGNIVRALGGRGKTKETISLKDVVFIKGENSPPKTSPDATSDTKSINDNQEPLTTLPKLAGLSPLYAKKKQEFVKLDDKKVEKKADEKKRDMSRVKCYNCKKEGHFSKDCKKEKVKDYDYYKSKMLLAKKDKDEQVLLAEDQAWMKSSSDSDHEINANMVFMAQIEKVLSDFEASSSSADEKIFEVSYYLSESECESEFENLEYYDNSTNYGLFVNNDDDQEIFHDAIASASENFIENHIDSQKDYDKSDVDHNDSKEKEHLVDKLMRKLNKKIVKCQKRVEKVNQQSKDFENQNKDLQDKYDVMDFFVISISTARVILFGTILTTVPATIPTIDLPIIHDDTSLIPTDTPTISPIVPAIPSIAPTIKYTSPFICTDSSDNDTSERPPSQDPYKRVRPLPTHRLGLRYLTDYSSSNHFTSDDSLRDSPSDSSVETSSDSHSDTSSNSSSVHSTSYFPCDSLTTISAGPSRKRRRSPTTSVHAASSIPRALSPIHADLLPPRKRIKDSNYVTDFEGSKEGYVLYVPRETGLGVDVEDSYGPYTEPNIDPDI